MVLYPDWSALFTMTDMSTYLGIGWESDGIEKPWLGRLWCLSPIHMLLSLKLSHLGRDSRETERIEKEAKVHYTSILLRHWICHICQCPSGHWRSMTETRVRGPLQSYRTWGKEYGRQMSYESSRRCLSTPYRHEQVSNSQAQPFPEHLLCA